MGRGRERSCEGANGRKRAGDGCRKERKERSSIVSGISVCLSVGGEFILVVLVPLVVGRGISARS